MMMRMAWMAQIMLMGLPQTTLTTLMTPVVLMTLTMPMARTMLMMRMATPARMKPRTRAARMD